MNEYVFLLSLCGFFGIAAILAKAYGDIFEQDMPWDDEQ